MSHQWWVGKRVKIIKAEGLTFAGLPCRDPRPEHIGKEGTIRSLTKSGIPRIALDDGSSVLGCDCWWRPLGWSTKEEK